MKKLRHATSQDKTAFRNLWNLSFTDSLGFRNWFFDNRFIPEYSICMGNDEKIVSAVQSIPCFIKIREAIVPATIMVGACTHPDYKRRGYMKDLYTWYMNYVHKLDIAVCAHTPAVLKTYFYVGHFPVSDTAFINIEKANPIFIDGITEIDLKGETAALLKCYTQKSETYSGIILRTFSDMRLKVNDYMADGAEGIALWDNNQLKGYGIYYNLEELLHGEEIIAIDESSEQKIVDALINMGAGKKVRIKLPPDTKVVCNQGTLEINPRNVLGLANVSMLLKAIGKNADYSIKINDEVVPENNGTFNLKGEKTISNPVCETSAGNILQWIVGYKSITELENEGVLKINNPMAAKELDKMFPKQKCHIIDEY